MTLHWWMHWFWVTAQFLAILANPVPSSTARARDLPSTESPSTAGTSAAEEFYRTAVARSSSKSFRVAKAIGPYPQTNTAAVLERQASASSSRAPEREDDEPAAVTGLVGLVGLVERPRANVTGLAEGPATEMTGNGASRRSSDALDRLRGGVAKKDGKIAWIEAPSKASRSKGAQQDAGRKDAATERVATVGDVEDLTVLPLREEGSKFRLVLNRTRSSSSSSSSSSSASLSSAAVTGSVAIRTFNRSDDDVEVDEEIVDAQPFATAASILEVGVGRTRSAFPRDFQRDQVQGAEPPCDYNDSDSGNGNASVVRAGSPRSAVDIAAITGSCLATVVLLSTMGSLGFIMYRRRYLNPPQTLNSDKCSNPDSSGYIDDSTIRDNSEEMYSLDNDSFLNSLEAMTIQNYWTDSVKHTKL